jgi:hypothetical protein
MDNLSKLLIFPAFLLSSLVIRILICGASIGDALGLAALAGFCGFCLYIESQKKNPVADELKSDIEYLKTEMLNIKNFQSVVKMSPKSTTLNFK